MLVEDEGWGAPVEHSSGPVIDLGGDVVQIVLGQSGEVDAAWEVLA